MAEQDQNEGNWGDDIEQDNEDNNMEIEDKKSIQDYKCTLEWIQKVLYPLTRAQIQYSISTELKTWTDKNIVSHFNDLCKDSITNAVSQSSFKSNSVQQKIQEVSNQFSNETGIQSITKYVANLMKRVVSYHMVNNLYSGKFTDRGNQYFRIMNNFINYSAFSYTPSYSLQNFTKYSKRQMNDLYPQLGFSSGSKDCMIYFKKDNKPMLSKRIIMQKDKFRSFRVIGIKSEGEYHYFMIPNCLVSQYFSIKKDNVIAVRVVKNDHINVIQIDWMFDLGQQMEVFLKTNEELYVDPYTNGFVKITGEQQLFKAVQGF